MNTENKLKSTKHKRFGFQRWPVYLALKKFVKSMNDLPNDGKLGLKKQLDRASLSLCLNVAEGYSNYGSQDRSHYLQVAKGSTFECVAVLDLMTELKLLDRRTTHNLVCQLAEIGKLLSGLLRS